MRYLKVFEEFEDIDSLCQKYGITNYEIVDGLVNVDGDVDLSNKSLTKIPIKFGSVSGDFYCHLNQLVSLEGSPNSVSGDFYCHNNKLVSLEGAPQTVGGDFICSYNILASLEGAPQTVGGDFDCSPNKLVSLEGAPNSVGGDSICSWNKLTSLEGASQTVGGFYCHGNPVGEIWNLFKDKSKIEFFNFMDPIRPPENEGELPICYLDILNEFLKEVGKARFCVKKVEGYNCI